MLSWAMTFLVIALIAGAFGLSGVAGTAAAIAKGLFVAFMVLFAISLAAGLVAGRRAARSIRKTADRERDLLHR